MLEFKVLGPLEVVRDGQVVAIGARKQRAVLAALLIARGRVVSLDRLIDQMWGDEPPSAAIASLQVYVSKLRQVLEPERAARTPSRVLVSRPPGYSLLVGPPGYDAAVFESAVANGHAALAEGRPRAAHKTLTAALAIWRGPALSEFSSEPFARAEAARLEEMRGAAAEARLSAALALGEHVAAIVEVQSLLAEHQLREGLWAALVLALYRSGRQGDALRACAEARRTLIEELGVQPGPALRRLEADVLAQNPDLNWQPVTEEAEAHDGQTAVPAAQPAVPAVPGAASLIGRDGPIRAVDDGLARVLAGRSSVVLVSGEAGIGKTRLAEEVAARAATRGLAVAWGTCHDGDEAPSFWPWVQILRNVLNADDKAAVAEAFAYGAAHIARIVPEVKELVPGVEPPTLLDAEAARFALYDAVSGALLGFSRHRPLLVVLDDLHWADPPSLQMLAFLSARLREARIVVLGTHRATDPSPGVPLTETLGALARHGVGVRVDLAGLDRSEVATFIAAVTGHEADDGLAQVITDRTEGNPFFLSELVAMLASEGALDRDRQAQIMIPAGVRDVVRRRLTRLSSQTATVLTTAAVVGRDFDLPVVEAACGLDPESALEAVEGALMSGFVSEVPSMVARYRFSHALVREAVAGELSAVRRARLHARIATAIEAQPGGHSDDVVLALAHHYHHAGPAGHAEAALSYALSAAAIDADRLAYESAEGHLDHALEALNRLPPGPERDARDLEVHIQCAILLPMTQGWAHPRIATVAARVLALSDSIGVDERLLTALIRLGGFHFVRAEYGATEAVAQQILEMGQGALDPAFLLGGHWFGGLVGLWRGQLDEAEEHWRLVATLRDALPERQGGWIEVYSLDPAVVARAGIAVAALLRGDGARARQLMADAMARTAGHPFNEVYVLWWTAWAAALEHDGVATIERAGECSAAVDRTGFRFFRGMTRVLQGWGIARVGDPERGVDAIKMGLADHQANGIQMLRPAFLEFLAEAQIASGRGHEALATVEEALREIENTGERLFEPELHRLRGELLNTLPSRATQAQACLAEAVTLARAQGNLVFERRAAASLASQSREPPSARR